MCQAEAVASGRRRAEVQGTGVVNLPSKQYHLLLLCACVLPAVQSAWSSVLDHPTAFAAADCIEHEDGPGSRIKFHYCIVEVRALWVL